MQSLAGKTALVTGAGRGIGRATALALAEEGVHVGLVGRTLKNLEKTAEELSRHAVSISVAEVDVADRGAVQQGVQQIKRDLGSIDILINNAGIGKFGSFLELTPEDWQEVLNVNVMGIYHVTQAILPDMLEKQAGDIINIASTSGLKGSPGSSAYSASKFAVRGLTEALMQEVRKHNIRVSTMNPSKVITDFFSNQDLPDDHEKRFMQAEDLAQVMVGQLKLHPRIFLKNTEPWATNPF